MIPAALTRGDIADYVSALFTVYFICILLFVVLSWIQAFRPLPYNTTLRAVTGFIDEVIKKIRQPHRDQVQKALYELLGGAAKDSDVELCELSIIGQCFAARHGRGMRTPASRAALTKSELEELAEHITRFSLAGIETIRKEDHR